MGGMGSRMCPVYIRDSNKLRNFRKVTEYDKKTWDYSGQNVVNIKTKMSVAVVNV